MGSIYPGRRGKQLVEDSLALDLAWLMRLAPIREGQAGSGEIEWSRAGETVAQARFQLHLRNAGNASLVIHWRLVSSSGSIPQTISLTALPQHFGGHRWWMRCPVTGDKVRILYLSPGGDHFAGRKALGLSYRVERLNRFDRPFEKLFRAQRTLGNAQGLGVGLEKPKGMWRRTFVRHAERFEMLDLDCAQKIAAMIESAGRGPQSKSQAHRGIPS